MKQRFWIYTQLRYAITARNHNIWGRSMVFQTLGMLTFVAPHPTRCCDYICN
jgi:hypothetical protein